MNRRDKWLCFYTIQKWLLSFRAFIFGLLCLPESVLKILNGIWTNMLDNSSIFDRGRGAAKGAHLQFTGHAYITEALNNLKFHVISQST